MQIRSIRNESFTFDGNEGWTFLLSEIECLATEDAKEKARIRKEKDAQ